MRVSLLAAAAVFAFLVSSASAEDVDLKNATCPVKGTPAKEGIVETYKGMTVHFCCTHCASKFKAKPEEYLDELRADPAVAKRMDAAQAVAGGTETAGTMDVAAWPDAPKRLATKLSETHGAPKIAEEARLVWVEKRPWKRIVVHREGAPLEQVVAYKADDVESLAAFREHATFDAKAGELSARHDTEALNLLALNLANEVATRKVTVDQAKDLWTKHELAVRDGKSSPYTEKLAFVVAKDEVAGPK
jgi:YHS domain-containing protein